jgi:hypothetical protein
MAERMQQPPGITQGDIGARYTRKRLSDEVYIGHYIKAGDRIRVRSTILTGVIASLTTVNLTIGGRVQGMDGDLVPFGDSFTFTADGVQTAQYIMAPEGYVVDLIVQSTSTGLTSGDLTVIVDIVQGVGSNAVAVGLLAYGYVYPAGLLGLNVSRNIGGGGGGMAIGGTVTSGTPGSVLFVGTGPVLAQDNTNLNWDDANNVLSVKNSTVRQTTVKLGPASGGLAQVEVQSTNDMQTLGSALYVEAADNGGALSGEFAGEEVVAVTNHTSGVLSVLRALRATAASNGGGGTVTTGVALNAAFNGGANFVTLIGLKVENVSGATNNVAIRTGTGMIDLGDVLKLPAVAIASLPATPALGMVEAVTDALTPIIGATVGAGGSAKALVWYNGANWTVIGV